MNLNLKTKGLRIIDPYLVLAIYEALLNSPREPVPETSFEFIRTRASHAQLRAKLVSLQGSAFNVAELSPEHRQHNQKQCYSCHTLNNISQAFPV